MGFRALSFLSQGGRNAVLLHVMARFKTALIYAPVGMLAYWSCCWHSTKAWRGAAWPALDLLRSCLIVGSYDCC